jgi:Homeobox KN domain
VLVRGNDRSWHHKRGARRNRKSGNPQAALAPPQASRLLPSDAKTLFRRWLLVNWTCPYPENDVFTKLKHATGVPLEKIKTWFSNNRRRWFPVTHKAARDELKVLNVSDPESVRAKIRECYPLFGPLQHDPDGLLLRVPVGFQFVAPVDLPQGSWAPVHPISAPINAQPVQVAWPQLMAAQPPQQLLGHLLPHQYPTIVAQPFLLPANIQQPHYGASQQPQNPSQLQRLSQRNWYPEQQQQQQQQQ